MNPQTQGLETLAGTVKEQMTRVEEQRAKAAQALIHQGAWLGALIQHDQQFLDALQGVVDRRKKDQPRALAQNAGSAPPEKYHRRRCIP